MRALEAMDDLDEPTELDIHPDRTRETSTPSFSTMRLDWRGDDGPIIASLASVVDRRLLTDFADAYEIMTELFLLVREPDYDENGEVLVDHLGLPEWRRTATGNFVEDWSKLGIQRREHFLFMITTRLFEWEQRAESAWGEAMWAKALWEEAFSRGFTAPTGRNTVDDRTHKGRVAAQDHRYFSILQSLYHRRAAALCRSMARLELRLSQRDR
jgi:hypothetical protein